MATEARTIADVLQDIVGNVQEIVRSEMRLAKGELQDQLSKVKAAAPLLLITIGAALLAGFFLAWAALYALVLVLPMWAAALVVALALGSVGIIAMTMGLSALMPLRPPVQTINSVKENMQWAKQQVK
jgi:uncharacterized membrane protein YqjE